LRIAGYDYKTLNRAIGRAIHDYDMIRTATGSLVGLSGGSDRPDDAVDAGRTPQTRPRRLPAVCRYIDPGFGARCRCPAALCERLEIPLRTELTDYGIVSHGPSNAETVFPLRSPAAVNGCSKLRRNWAAARWRSGTTRMT